MMTSYLPLGSYATLSPSPSPHFFLLQKSSKIEKLFKIAIHTNIFSIFFRLTKRQIKKAFSNLTRKLSNGLVIKKVYIRNENNNNIRSYEIISRKKAFWNSITKHFLFSWQEKNKSFIWSVFLWRGDGGGVSLSDILYISPF